MPVPLHRVSVGDHDAARIWWRNATDDRISHSTGDVDGTPPRSFQMELMWLGWAVASMRTARPLLVVWFIPADGTRVYPALQGEAPHHGDRAGLPGTPPERGQGLGVTSDGTTPDCCRERSCMVGNSRVWSAS